MVGWDPIPPSPPDSAEPQFAHLSSGCNYRAGLIESLRKLLWKNVQLGTCYQVGTQERLLNFNSATHVPGLLWRIKGGRYPGEEIRGQGESGRSSKQRLFLTSSLVAPGSESAPAGFWLGMWHGGKWGRERERNQRDNKDEASSGSTETGAPGPVSGEAEIGTQVYL